MYPWGQLCSIFWWRQKVDKNSNVIWFTKKKKKKVHITQECSEKLGVIEGMERRNISM